MTFRLYCITISQYCTIRFYCSKNNKIIKIITSTEKYFLAALVSLFFVLLIIDENTIFFTYNTISTSILIEMYKPVDKAFQKIGNKHTYQKLLVVYLFIMAGFVNYLLVGPTFIFMNPLFQCNFSEELVD